MDDKKLKKMFSNKKFLKQNDFATLLSKGTKFCRENKALVILAIVVVVVISLAVPTYNWYNIKTIQSFNKDFYNAEKSLKKEALYKNILEEYSRLPASQLARLKLVDTLLNHQKEEEAITLIEEGLSNGEANIFNTLLILKRVNLLKEKKRYEEAAKFITTKEHNVIKTFKDQLKLIQGDLFLLANKKDLARKNYEAIISISETQDITSKDSVQNPTTVKAAKDKILLLDLGIL